MALFGGKPLSRLDELKKIVAKDPSSRQFLALAEEYRKLGRLREAMETLERGIQAIPGYVAAYVALGRTYQQMGLPDQAIVAYGSALKFDRENLVAIRQIADAYLKKGEKVEAIKKLKLFRALKSGDPEVEQLIQQLDAELNPPRPKAPDTWPTSGGLRAPASPFAPRPASQPIPSALPEPAPARFEPLRPPLETSGAFARRDYPKPPDFSAAPYPKDRQSAFSSGGSAFAPPPPGVEEPSPMPTGRPDSAPGALARVDPPSRPGPPPTPPPRPLLLVDPPAASPFVAFDAVVEPRPLPRRDATPSGPTAIGATTGSVTLPERTGPIGRARIPDPAELLELTFDGALRRRSEPSAPVTAPVAPAAEVPVPASRREQTTAPVVAPVEPKEVRSASPARPITLPIPEVAPISPPSPWPSTPSLAPPVEEAQADSVFDFEEEPLLAPQPVETALEPLAVPIPREAGEPFPSGTDAAVHLAEAEPELPAPAPEPEPVLELPSEPSPFESEPAPVVTETLAELYRSQGHVVEARDAYGTLAAAEPDEARARELEARAAALSERLDRSRGLRRWASRLKSPIPAEIESLGEVLESLISGTEGVRAASLTDLEGLPVVSAGEPVMETLVAELTAFWKGVQRVRDDIGAGPLKCLTFTAGDGAAIVAAASPEYSLILRTDRDVPLGRIRYEVGRVSALLRPVLG